MILENDDRDNLDEAHAMAMEDIVWIVSELAKDTKPTVEELAKETTTCSSITIYTPDDINALKRSWDAILSIRQEAVKRAKARAQENQ